MIELIGGLLLWGAMFYFFPTPVFLLVVILAVASVWLKPGVY